MDEETWKGLLKTALAILDDIDADGVGAPEVAMGGGAVLMMRMRHRLSRDIDLFMRDAQWLARLTPRLNDRIAAIVRDYSEQANSIKLVLPEGDIDFIVAGRVTEASADETLDFGGHTIMLEATEEILAKKLYYRAGLLKPRDVFDLVAAARVFPSAAEAAVEASASRRQAQLKRLEALAAAPPDQLLRDIAPIGEFAEMAPVMVDAALAWIESVDEKRRRPR